MRFDESALICRDGRRGSAVFTCTMRVLIVEDEPDLAAAVATGLRAEGFDVDVSHDGLDGLWRATVDAGADPLAAANVIANAVVAAGLEPAAVPAAELARLVDARDRIPRAAFDEAIARLAEPGFSADPFLAQEVVSDSSSLEPIIDAVIAASPGQVAAFRGGKEGLLGYFVGQVMKETKGQADPRAVSDLVRSKLTS